MGVGKAPAFGQAQLILLRKAKAGREEFFQNLGSILEETVRNLEPARVLVFDLMNRSIVESEDLGFRMGEQNRRMGGNDELRVLELAQDVERYVPTQEEQLGPFLLRQVSELTGGQASTSTNAGEMPAVTRNIGDRLRNQYVLAYQPQAAPHDGNWHKLSVKLRLPKNLPFFHVANKTGYCTSAE